MSSATCMPHSSPQRFGEGAWERVEGGGQKERRRKERRGWRVEGERRVEGEGGILFFPSIFFEMYTLYVALAKLHLSSYIVHPPSLSPLNLTNLQTGEMSRIVIKGLVVP